MKNTGLLLLTLLLLAGACTEPKKTSYQPQSKPNFRVVLQFDFPASGQREMLLDSAKNVLARRMQDVFAYSSLNADPARQTVTIDLIGKLFSPTAPSDSTLNFMTRVLAAEGRLEFFDTYRFRDTAILTPMLEMVKTNAEFAQLINFSDAASAVIGYVHPKKIDEVGQALQQAITAGSLPADCVPAWSAKPFEQGRMIFHELYFLKNQAVVTNRHLLKAEATPAEDKAGEGAINLVFNPAGTALWSAMTTAAAQNGNREIAIVFEGRVLVAPRVINPITEGRSQITGSFTPAEAVSLAHLLESGALPGPARVLQAEILR